MLWYSIDLWSNGGGGLGICAFCYMWNFYGVAVFHTSMLNWRGWGQSAMGICAYCYMWNLFGVVVFQRSILDWRRGWGQSAMVICVFFYMWKLFGVVVFQRSMLNWRGMGSVCHGYVYILLYVKLIWCSGFPESYAHLGGLHLISVFTSFENDLILLFTTRCHYWGVYLISVCTSSDKLT